MSSGWPPTTTCWSRSRTACCPAASAQRWASTCSTTASAGDVRLLRLGLPDRYVTHGKPALLRKEVGMEPDQIAERVMQVVLDPHDLLQNA